MAWLPPLWIGAGLAGYGYSAGGHPFVALVGGFVWSWSAFMIGRLSTGQPE